MYVVPFTIPKLDTRSFHFQEDILPHFYGHLHRHQEVQMTLILKGSGTLVAENRMHVFTKGDFFLLGSGQSHLFREDEDALNSLTKSGIHTLNLFFAPQGIIRPLFDLPEMTVIIKWLGSASSGLKLINADVKVLEHHFRQVQNTGAADRLAAFIRMLQYLASDKQWHPLADVSPVKYSETEGMRMDDIYQYCMRHFKREISLDEIAGIAYMTPQAFCRYFKKHTLKTFTEFVNELRINEACRLLVSDKHRTISSIAYQCGFNHAVTFNRVFRDIMKMSPTEYLKNINAINKEEKLSK